MYVARHLALDDAHAAALAARLAGSRVEGGVVELRGTYEQVIAVLPAGVEGYVSLESGPLDTVDAQPASSGDPFTDASLDALRYR